MQVKCKKSTDLKKKKINPTSRSRKPGQDVNKKLIVCKTIHIYKI